MQTEENICSKYGAAILRLPRSVCVPRHGRYFNPYFDPYRHLIEWRNAHSNFRTTRSKFNFNGRTIAGKILGDENRHSSPNASTRNAVNAAHHRQEDKKKKKAYRFAVMFA